MAALNARAETVLTLSATICPPLEQVRTVHRVAWDNELLACLEVAVLQVQSNSQLACCHVDLGDHQSKHQARTCQRCSLLSRAPEMPFEEAPATMTACHSVLGTRIASCCWVEGICFPRNMCLLHIVRLCHLPLLGQSASDACCVTQTYAPCPRQADVAQACAPCNVLRS